LTTTVSPQHDVEGPVELDEVYDGPEWRVQVGAAACLTAIASELGLEREQEWVGQTRMGGEGGGYGVAARRERGETSQRQRGETETETETGYPSLRPRPRTGSSDHSKSQRRSSDRASVQFMTTTCPGLAACNSKLHADADVWGRMGASGLQRALSLHRPSFLTPSSCSIHPAPTAQWGRQWSQVQ